MELVLLFLHLVIFSQAYAWQSSLSSLQTSGRSRSLLKKKKILGTEKTLQLKNQTHWSRGQKDGGFLSALHGPWLSALAVTGAAVKPTFQELVRHYRGVSWWGCALWKVIPLGYKGSLTV